MAADKTTMDRRFTSSAKPFAAIGAVHLRDARAETEGESRKLLARHRSRTEHTGKDCILKFALFATMLFGLSALAPAVSMAQTPAPMGAAATATLTAKIVAIDSTNRLVTLQDAQGNTKTIQVGPGVTRFSALKVGDMVTFTYQESVALSIVKASAAAPMAQATPTVTRAAGDKPGGTISQTQVATVTIASIDLTTPSVTVTTQDGKTISMLVHDPANLNGLKVGDVVQITYNQALAISVK
jgi:Cu/Ag efflux protein CusF